MFIVYQAVLCQYTKWWSRVKTTDKQIMHRFDILSIEEEWRSCTSLTHTSEVQDGFQHLSENKMVDVEIWFI